MQRSAWLRLAARHGAGPRGAATLLLSALLGVAAGRIGAQPATTAVPPDSGAHASRPQPLPAPPREYMVSMWTGLSTSSTTWAPLGAAPDTHLGMLAVRIARRLGATTQDGQADRHSLWYTFDIIPAAIISPPYVSAPQGSGCPRRRVCAIARSDSAASLFSPGSVYGVGVTPIGVTALLRSHSALQFTLGATGGAMWFSKAVPTTRASRGNFTAALETGVRFATRCGRAISFTYRLHHISNAWFGDENPAVGSHLLSIGVDRGGARQRVDSNAC